MVKVTEKQKTVLRMVADGYTREEISKKLKCTLANIDNFMSRLQIKFMAKNKANIVYKAMKEGVID